MAAAGRRISAFFRSFAGRIIIGGVVIHLVLIPTLFSGVLFIVARGYEEQFVNYVRNDAHQLAEHLSEQSSLDHVRIHLDEAVFSGRAIYADVVLANGDIIASAGNSPKRIENFSEDFYFGERDDYAYHIALPFPVLALQMPAPLRLVFVVFLTQEQIKQAYQRGIMLSIGYILLSLLLVAVVTPQLTRPLRRLRDAAQRIAGGNLTEHLRVGSAIHEIADLAEDLERMRETLIQNTRAIATRERRISAIMDNVVDGIVTIDVRGNIESMNRAAEKIFGLSQDLIIGENINVLLAQPYSCDIGTAADAHGGTSKNIANVAAHETVGRHQDGHTFAMEMAISELPRAEGALFIAILRDITERKQAEADLKALQEDLERRVIKRTRELAALNRVLEHQALHDGLTELPNRLLLQDRLRQAILSAQRKQHRLALLITDLDRFKEINATLGRHYGVLEGQGFHVGASIGIALYPEHGDDGATLMRHADVAMYVAKRSTSGFCLYDPREDQHSVSRLALVSELRLAIEHKQLVLFYQPKIDLRHGRVVAVEAVVRWDHPQRGLLLPDEFIPLAEHTGLIRPLTFLVLDEALHQMHLWQQGGLKLRVAINLSARHLQDENLAERIGEAMAHWGVAPELLEFEITESANMSNQMRAMDTLTALDAMGVGLSIDDFGTGYSSLIYLKQLPVDEIKIDKSFVIDMLDNNEDFVIVRSTVDLAHNMGRRVVAEGVESQAVLNILLELGCDMAQGYHISRPVTAPVLTRWLTNSEWRLQNIKGSQQA